MLLVPPGYTFTSSNQIIQPQTERPCCFCMASAMPLFRLSAHRARPSSVSAVCATSLQWDTGCLLRSATGLLLSATCLQGWSKFYEFSFSDQRAGVDVISLGTQNGRAPQWEYLHGLLENAIYGGRIDNGHDVLVSIKAPQLGLLW